MYKKKEPNRRLFHEAVERFCALTDPASVKVENSALYLIAQAYPHVKQASAVGLKHLHNAVRMYQRCHDAEHDVALLFQPDSEHVKNIREMLSAIKGSPAAREAHQATHAIDEVLSEVVRLRPQVSLADGREVIVRGYCGPYVIKGHHLSDTNKQLRKKDVTIDVDSAHILSVLREPNEIAPICCDNPYAVDICVVGRNGEVRSFNYSDGKIHNDRFDDLRHAVLSVRGRDLNHFIVNNPHKVAPTDADMDKVEGQVIPMLTELYPAKVVPAKVAQEPAASRMV